MLPRKVPEALCAKRARPLAEAIKKMRRRKDLKTPYSARGADFLMSGFYHRIVFAEGRVTGIDWDVRWLPPRWKLLDGQN